MDRLNLIHQLMGKYVIFTQNFSDIGVSTSSLDFYFILIRQYVRHTTWNMFIINIIFVGHLEFFGRILMLTWLVDVFLLNNPDEAETLFFNHYSDQFIFFILIFIFYFFYKFINKIRAGPGLEPSNPGTN